MSLRLWIGVWIGVFMVLLCAFEISAWVAYITRFTEENFAMLIATIYVYKAVEKIIKIGVCNPLYPPQIDPNATDCFCVPSNETGDVVESIPWIGLPLQNCTEVQTLSQYSRIRLYHPVAYIGHFRPEPNFYIIKPSGYIIQPSGFISHFERC